MKNGVAIIAAALLLTLNATRAQALDPVEAQRILKSKLPETAEVQLALSAAPPSLRSDATVYVFGDAGYRLFRTGGNGLTCLLNRDAFLYGSPAFKPTCWDTEGKRSYVPVMLHVGQMLAGGHTPDQIKADIAAGFKADRFHQPQRTGVAYMLAGDVELDTTTGSVTKQAFTGHYMIYAPGVTNADIGSRPNSGADKMMPFIFDLGAGGSNLAYLIAVPQHIHTP